MTVKNKIKGIKAEIVTTPEGYVVQSSGIRETIYPLTDEGLFNAKARVGWLAANRSWLSEHLAALKAPRPGFENALELLLRGFEAYASAHAVRYESPIGEDLIMGEAWQMIGHALIGMLGGDTGRFDCGTLDARIRKVLADNGIDSENA